MPHQDHELYAIQKKFVNKLPIGIEKAINSLINDNNYSSDIKYLDFGCGDGKCFDFLINKKLSKSNIYGLDASKLRIERCHKIGWDNAKYLKPGNDLPFDNNFFDIISLIEVIEHIPRNQINKLLNEIQRVIKPTGSLILTTPNYPIKRFYDFVDAFTHRNWRRFFDDPTHVSPYSYKRLESILNRRFANVKQGSFKDGFLYSKSKFKHNLIRHKLLYRCCN